MLFIIPDFLKASTPAVGSKYFQPPPCWTKKVPVASPECLYSIGRGQRPIKIGLLFTQLYD